jgi:SAM-dependent methyltransferase
VAGAANAEAPAGQDRRQEGQRRSRRPGARRSPNSDEALLRLLQTLDKRGYRFVTPTDATHRTVLRRAPDGGRRSLSDIFGWNRAFAPGDLDPDIFELMRRGNVLRRVRAGLRSTVRVSSLGDRLFIHTGFPTLAEDAVFFGPDTYRFARFLKAQLSHSTDDGVLADIGAGCGAGGLLAADLAPGTSLVLADINPKALRLARINALHAQTDAQLVLSSGLDAVSGPLAIAIANPPYIAGRKGQTYQDGGDLHGASISAHWATQAMQKLRPGGRMLLYTGAAIVRGKDALKARLARAAHSLSCDLDYEEIDPDVFGEELRQPAYADVDRIAAVGAVMTRR